MSRHPTVADVRAAITSHAPGPAQPAGPSVADVGAAVYGNTQRGRPAAGATTENPGPLAHGATEFNTPAPALAVPAPAVGSNSGDPAIEAYAETESPGSPLDPSVPGHAALAAAGIETIDDLRAVADLTRIPGIGKTTARHIRDWLEAAP